MSLSIKTPKEVSMEIAARLKARRLSQNLTQVGVALRSGMSTASLKRFEKTGEISFVSLLKVALVLDCLDECDRLFENNNKPVSLFTDEAKPKKRGSIK